jgi:hypothetical protein
MFRCLGGSGTAARTGLGPVGGRHTECACYLSATAHGVCGLPFGHGTRSVRATFRPRHTECAGYLSATAHGVCGLSFGHRTRSVRAIFRPPHTECAGYLSATAHGVCLLPFGHRTRSVRATGLGAGSNPSSPLKKGTGTSRLPFLAGKCACPFGASPLFQRAASALPKKGRATLGRFCAAGILTPA